MISGIEAVNIFSEDAKKLADFYKNKVGIKVSLEAEMGENGEEVYGFEFGQGPGLFIMDHSKVKGSSKEPNRCIFNLEVDDIEKEVEKLEKLALKKPKIHTILKGMGIFQHLKMQMGIYFSWPRLDLIREFLIYNLSPSTERAFFTWSRNLFLKHGNGFRDPLRGFLGVTLQLYYMHYHRKTIV